MCGSGFVALSFAWGLMWSGGSPGGGDARQGLTTVSGNPPAGRRLACRPLPLSLHFVHLTCCTPRLTFQNLPVRPLRRGNKKSFASVTGASQRAPPLALNRVPRQDVFCGEIVKRRDWVVKQEAGTGVGGWQWSDWRPGRPHDTTRHDTTRHGMTRHNTAACQPKQGAGLTRQEVAESSRDYEGQGDGKRLRGPGWRGKRLHGPGW